MPTLCPSTEGQSQAWGCLAETQFPIRTAKSLSFSLPQGRCTAQSSAPHLHQPSPQVSALQSDARSPGHSPSSSHLRPGAPAPPLPRLLRSACPAGPQLQPVCALVCAAGLNPKRRMIPGRSQARRRREDSESMHVRSDTQVQHSGRKLQVMGSHSSFRNCPEFRGKDFFF